MKKVLIILALLAVIVLVLFIGSMDRLDLIRWTRGFPSWLRALLWGWV